VTESEEHIRPGTEDDLATLIVLLRDTMGWDDDERSTAFFEWKHRQNPFGPSPVWVGLDEAGEVIALRTFLRWEFTGASQPLRAVRAVDTATHPDHQGKGWFSRLTMHAIEELRADGVDFIFNTPNDKSWPGYEKMGWLSRGKLTLAVRPRLTSLGRLREARTAAEKWNEPTGSAPTAADVLPDLGPDLEKLVEAQPERLHATVLSADLVRWRYGFRPLSYQVLSLGGDPAEGIVIYRVRQRGPAQELTVTQVLLPDGASGRARKLIGAAMADSGADVAVTIPPSNPLAWGMVPAPRLGPLLTVRTVNTEPPDLALGLGDVELF
jgi:GNAT superfamily N-acetyltransferase